MSNHNILSWTDAMDDSLRTMRAAGAAWSVIASKVAVSRGSVIKRAQALNIYDCAKPAIRAEIRTSKERDAAGAFPLYAGHPISMDALKRGPALDD